MRKNSCRRPSREKAVAVKTMKVFCVSPKIAGMESSANRMSVPPMATITSSIGVIARLPLVDGEQLVAVVVVGGGDQPAGEPDDDVVARSGTPRPRA